MKQLPNVRLDALYMQKVSAFAVSSETMDSLTPQELRNLITAFQSHSNHYVFQQRQAKATMHSHIHTQTDLNLLFL